jgi:hypothetical protein
MPAFLKRNEPEPQHRCSEQPAAGDLPADFEKMLDELTKTRLTKNSGAGSTGPHVA